MTSQRDTVWIQLTAGRGPIECQIAVARISDIIRQTAIKQGLNAALIDETVTDIGCMSTLTAIDGPTAERFAQTWSGTIQWICPSPVRTTKRKNWFIGANLIIEPTITEANLDDRSLKFEAFRASGPGGQHVNKTSSAIRVTHLPTGVIAQAQEERSQHRNKSLAMARLAAALASRTDDAIRETETSKWQQHDQLIRGNPVRTYVGAEFSPK